MALKLDNALLEELGLGALPDAEKQLLLRQIYEKLEMNVGMRLADQMSNEQLDAFEKFVDANDDKGAFQWLEQNFPNYKMVVNEEFEKLKAEIRSVAPQILATAQENQGQSQPQYSQQPGQPPQPAPQAQPGYQQPQQLQYAPQQPQQGGYAPQPQQPAPQPGGHLQPQYGVPVTQQPQYPPQAPPYPQPQPPAGPSQ